MSKSSFRFLFMSLFLIGIVNVSMAQRDLLKGILDKEEPVFHADISTTENDGSIHIKFYFTHSKLNEIEASFWIKDLGASFQENNPQKLGRGLRKYGNRQEYSFEIEGLKAPHFYSIGIDYRSPNGLARKFHSFMLEEGFKYDGKKTSTSEVATSTSAQPQDNNSSFETEVSNNTAQPCINPDIKISVDPTGYCDNFKKPAVLIQCLNCQAKEWEFNVEVRKDGKDWIPLRADGMRQQAMGVSLRTEPFCALGPGIYEVQVLAWGKNCDSPVLQIMPTSIVVADPNATNAWQQASTTPSEPKEEMVSRDVPLQIPETCTVLGVAYLEGNTIRGTIELDLDSPCAEMSPTAQVKYINPGYRDMILDDIYLLPGSKIPFEFELEQRDLNRGIHTLQIIEQVDIDQKVQVSSSWIKAIPKVEPRPHTPVTEDDLPGPEVAATAEPAQPIDEDSYDFSIDEQQIEQVSVIASDPNCNQIQDLQLVYGSGKADLPLFISWLSPRCCQEDGCNYTIWAGEDHNKLRLMVKGNKPGAIVRELLQNIRVGDAYYEVVVKTGNGTRKAAYVIGEGPKYGYEEILAYRDKIDPPTSDAFQFEHVPEFSYQKPNLPIEKFRSCRIFRSTTVSNDGLLELGAPTTIKYDYTEKGYQYSLYQLPSDGSDWVIAPGTQELANSATFTFTAQQEHVGKYVILAYNPSLNWGCLSKSISEAVLLQFSDE